MSTRLSGSPNIRAVRTEKTAAEAISTKVNRFASMFFIKTPSRITSKRKVRKSPHPMVRSSFKVSREIPSRAITAAAIIFLGGRILRISQESSGTITVYREMIKLCFPGVVYWRPMVCNVFPRNTRNPTRDPPRIIFTFISRNFFTQKQAIRIDAPT